MSLCVWSALHLNIPEYGSSSNGLASKISWVLIGLTVPEVVAWTAFQQRREASRLQRIMRSTLGQEPPQRSFNEFCKRIWRFFSWASQARDPRSSRPENQPLELENFIEDDMPKRHLWTMCHSHYALMGGFAFDACNMNTNVLPHGKQRLVLSPGGIESLAKIDINLLPDISSEHIQDKSKRSSLGKFLFCAQAFWFCFQCVVRLANGLSISILELNTLAHALCTLFICLMWWHKPYDVEDSTLIAGEGAAEIAALFSTFGSVSRDIPVLYTPLDNLERRHENYLWKIGLRHQALQPYAPGFSGISHKCELGLPEGSTRLYIREPLYDFLFDAATLKSIISERATISEWGVFHEDPFSYRWLYNAPTRRFCNHVDLNPNQKRRFEMAQRAIARYQLENDQLANLESPVTLLALHISNHSLSTQLTADVALGESAYGSMPASLAFGLLYFTAWDAPFTSSAQGFWRGVLVISLVCGLMLVVCSLIFRSTKRNVIGLLFVWSNFVARIYMFIICFWSLWWLPDSVYDVPSQTSYFPHIS
jgi:hypothetical protein